MCVSFQVFGIIFIIGMRAMMDKVSIFGANITLSSFLLFGMILTGINSTQSCAFINFHCSLRENYFDTVPTVHHKWYLHSWKN